ncbi:MAG: hypothetical protein NZM35_10205 [Chitinophagales bacterium]|nr:hypothetical protein [Chitinophagales bacterium]MDW8419923.1 hypothetical protein [Chitinophagales bacterium]
MSDNQNHFACRAIIVREIILHDRTDAYLFGYYLKGTQQQYTQFVIGRKLLHKLLRANGQKGERVIQYLKDCELHPHPVPITLNVAELLGEMLTLQADYIQLQIPFVVQHDGSLEPLKNDSILFIDPIHYST